MSSTFTLKDWTVYGLSDETAAPSFDAPTNTLTLSPSLTDTAPIVYQFYDNLFDIGTPAGQVRNDLRFDLKLSLATNTNTDVAYSDVIVDAITMDPVNVVGNAAHPTLAHFHPSAATATPGSLTQSNAYRMEQGSAYATHLQDLNGATRVHLSGNQIDTGETATWTAAKVHHWDGVFSLVVTPIAASVYNAPYGDVGNRLQGLSAGNPTDGSQFAYENVVNQHFTPDVVGTDRNDLLVGSDGDSSITGSNGRDTALGRAGNDVLSGGLDSDFLYGQDGMDTLSGGDGNDIADGGNDADWVDGGIHDDLVLGGAGNDTVLGGDGDDTVDGGLDEDVVDGGYGNDSLIGGYGNDLVTGGYGNDQMRGNFGHDTLSGGFGDDTLSGGENNDELNGDEGNDVLAGGFSLDTLDGGAGDDTLDGGPDADVVRGGSGQDHLTGGEGADRFDFNSITESSVGAGHDIIEDFSHDAGDKFDVVTIDAQKSIGTSNDAFTYIGSAEFGGVAGQLRYAGGLVQADWDGDRIADFEVQLVGAPALQAGDFYL
jgi:Ca2+-binding RTX toxin-like protein